MGEKDPAKFLKEKGFVQLSPENVRAFAENMASAYTGYPVFDWTFDRKCNPSDMTKFFTITLKTMMKNSFTFASDSEARSLISLIAPGEGVTTTWDYIRAGGISLYGIFGFSRIRRIEAYEAYSESMRQKYCSGDCWYYYNFTTRREYQGQGIGRPLWRSVLEWMDQEGRPIYLETAREQNVETYRRYGFELLEAGRLPGTDVMHFGMKRMPKKE